MSSTLVPLAQQHEDTDSGLTAGGRPIPANLTPSAVDNGDTPARGYLESPDPRRAGQSAFASAPVPVDRQDGHTQEVSRG